MRYWRCLRNEKGTRRKGIHDDFNLHRKINETAVVCNVENDQGELAQDDQRRKII